MGEPQKVLTVLETDAQFEGTKIAIASRTGEIEAAKECMRLIEVDIKGEMSKLRALWRSIRRAKLRTLISSCSIVEWRTRTCSSSTMSIAMYKMYRD